MINKTILSAQTVKTIKAHVAYNWNVGREEEANMTLAESSAGVYTIDDWGTNNADMYGDFFGGASLDNLSLKQALNLIYKANRHAERNDFFTATWYMKGL